MGRTIIDYSDDDTAEDVLGGPSLDGVILFRGGAEVRNLNIRAANVLWWIQTLRTGFDSAEVTFRYTTGEAAPFVESSLRLFSAVSNTGPWADVTDTLDTGRNEISATVSDFIPSFFAIGGTSVVPNTQTWVDFGFNGQEIGTQPNPFNTIKEAAQFIVANGTVNIQPGTSSETFWFSKKMTLKTTGGTVRIGD
jgi:hypothetical protein